MGPQYTSDECLNALRRARARLGSSPTRREYDELGIRPSSSVIRSRFGSWNEAKREAGLSLCRGGREPMAVISDFFEEIDTRTAAYWLGFLFGDGCIIERGSGMQVRLSLHKRDLDHLLKFKQTIRCGAAIVRDGEMRSLAVGDSTFAAHLVSHSFTPTKGTDGSLPELTRWDLRRAFVRGLADADGYYGEKRWTITDANDRRLRRLRPWIPVEYDTILEERSSKSWAYLRVSRKHRLRALYQWLFPRNEQTTPAMERKRDSAMRVLSDLG